MNFNHSQTTMRDFHSCFTRGDIDVSDVMNTALSRFGGGVSDEFCARGDDTKEVHRVTITFWVHER